MVVPTVLLGDCMRLLPTLGTGSVGMVLADPPYSNTGHDWDNAPDWEKWWIEIRRVLRPRGATILHTQGRLTGLLIESNPRWYRHTLIWVKNSTTGQLNARRAPLRAHEEILVFCSGQSTYHPQMWEGSPSHSRSAGTRTDRFYGGTTDTSQAAGLTARFPRSVLHFDRVHPAKTLMPSQKPVPLLEWLIRTYSDPDDLVLDPFVGSGSTLVAAAAAGRPALGLELDPDRHAIACARLREGIDDRSPVVTEPPEGPDR